MITIDTKNWQSGPDIIGEDDDDMSLLRKMYRDAVAYMASFSLPPPVENMHLAYGIGGVIAVFLMKFEHENKNGDILFWVIVGDIPSAYLVVDDSPDPKAALQIYCELMSDWANAVLSKQSLKNVFPVEAAATKVNAKQLLNRIGFIEKNIMPDVRA